MFTKAGAHGDRLEALAKQAQEPLDPEVFATYATWSPLVDRASTVFRNISCELVDERPVELQRLPTSASEAPGALRSTLEAAIASAIGDASRIAVLTGGGVDSGILLALSVAVGRRLGKEVFAVALDYDGGGGDDRPYLLELSRHLGCEVVRVAPESGAAHLALLDGVDAAPFYCPTGPMEVAAIASAKAAGATRILTGAGGDQLFDGRASDLSRVARRGHVLGAITSARKLRGFGRPRSPVLKWVARPLLSSLLPARLRATRAAGSIQTTAWAGPAMHELVARRRAQTIATLSSSLPDLRPYENESFAAQRMQFEWLRHQETIATDVVRVDPFLDPSVIAFARGIPREWHLSGGIRRGLLRMSARDLIPHALFARESKASFLPGLARFLDAAGGDAAFREFANVDALAALGVVDPPAFQTAYRTLVDSPALPAGWMGAWCVLALERFARARQR